MNGSEKPVRRLTMAEARQSPCFSCSTSPCCTYLPLHKFQVNTLKELDHAIYLLNFERIELGLSPTGEWSVFYRFPCRFLDMQNPSNYLCSIHGTELQPRICVHYNPYACWYRPALGSPNEEFIRIDQRRMQWITDRIVFDDYRNIVEVPTWPQLVEMCKETPLEEGFAPSPEPDPVFEQWLEESGAGPTSVRSPSLRVYQSFVDPCGGCEAHCCKTLVFPFGRPVTRRNLDFLQFVLGFPGMEVGISDGDWQIIVKTRCRHLTVDNRCGVYGQPDRPSLCSYFDASSCTYVAQFGTPRPIGFLRVQLEQFFWLTEALAFTDDGTLVPMPPTEAIRTHVEQRWSEAVAAEAGWTAAPGDELAAVEAWPAREPVVAAGAIEMADVAKAAAEVHDPPDEMTEER